MKFQLYSFGESGHSYKVALALHFSKANWEQIFIDFFRGEARSETYKNEINRMAEVPVLVFGDKKISQSGAILDYLNGKTGNYFGKNDEDRSEILRWVLWDNSKLSGSLGPTRFLMNFIPKDKKPVEVINYLQKRNDTALAVLESHLSGKNWVAADQLSAADLSCCSYLFYPEEFGFDRKSYPNIDRWLSNIEELTNWKHPYDLLERAYPPK